MARARQDGIVPTWLRPAAVGTIVLVHAGIVIGAPWPSTNEPAVTAPLAIQVVPEGRMTAAIAAPEQVQIAAVDAVEAQPVDVQPSQAKAVEAPEVNPPRKPERTQVTETEAKEVKPRVPERIDRAIDPDAPSIRAIEPREQVEPDDTPEQVAAVSTPLPRTKPRRRNKTPAAQSAPARSRARAMSQQAMARAVTGSIASANYRSIVAAELNRRKFYPPAARSSGVEGVVVVDFTVGASGRVTRHAILRSSGQPMLDQAVHNMMASLSLPPPPGGSFRARVPVRFDIAR